jgi:hypothetical protein
MRGYEKDIENYEVTQKNFQSTSGTASSGDLVVIEVTKDSQLSHLSITAGEKNDFEVVRRDQDGSNETTKLSYHTDSLQEGSFRFPVLDEIGASKEVAVKLLADGSSGVSYHVNLKAHERTG